MFPHFDCVRCQHPINDFRMISNVTRDRTWIMEPSAVHSDQFRTFFLPQHLAVHVTPHLLVRRAADLYMRLPEPLLLVGAPVPSSRRVKDPFDAWEECWFAGLLACWYADVLRSLDVLRFPPAVLIKMVVLPAGAGCVNAGGGQTCSCGHFLSFGALPP